MSYHPDTIVIYLFKKGQKPFAYINATIRLGSQTPIAQPNGLRYSPASVCVLISTVANSHEEKEK